MGAINFGSGFQSGYETADRSFARHKNADLAGDRFEETKNHNHYMRGNSDLQTKAIQGRAASEAGQLKLDQTESLKESLKERAKANMQSILNGGAGEKGLSDLLNENDMSHYTPEYWVNNENLKNNLGLGAVLRQVGAGDFSQVNTPETLGLMSKVYEAQIDRGAGELSASTGRPIVRKGLAGLRSAPNGAGIVALLDVEYQDGSRDQKPITLNRSSDPNDPVAITSMEDMLDDVSGRVRLAEIFSQPEVQESLRAANSHLFGTEAKPDDTEDIKNIRFRMSQGEKYEDIVKGMYGDDKTNLTGKAAVIDYLVNQQGLDPTEAINRVVGDASQSGSGGGKATPQIQNIKYLIENGMDRKEATNLVMFAKANPSSEIGRIFASLNSNNFGRGKQSESELYQQAIDLFMANQGKINGPSGGDAGGFPQEDIQRVIDGNPGTSRAKAISYLEHLRSEGQY